MMTFDSFVRTPSSARAYRMCRSFARSDNRHMRVLLIHGTTGTGKSHLLSAVESAYRRRRPERPVLHTMAADMAHALAVEVRADRMAHVEAAYADVALFIVDDLQALWEKPATQGLLGETLGRLVAGGALLVGAATAPLQALAPFRSACERWVPVRQCSVTAPGVREIRTILEAMTAKRRVKLSASMSLRVARHCRGDVRRAIGALNQLQAQKTLSIPRTRLPWIEEVGIPVSW